MKNSRFGVQFVFRKPKGATRSVLPIYLRISAGGQRTEVSTRRSWQPVRWDATTGRAMGTREDARTLNAYLSALQTRVYDVYLQLVNAHQDVTAEALKDGLSGVKKSGRTLIPIFQRHNEQLAKLVGAEFAQATLARYEDIRRTTLVSTNWIMSL
ncbi:Arm DNA-binding domain-containing protein [Parachryseolinea silvisoli]|uniref:Arm DNA-binding domain-containing protein n=1 Tax=Parachryseolinea silvisoli TaxID=2873601 RepID=UPI002265D9D8|nr:Arm DNA-binding domain-containing protein [Parachryseolinea silvisoli]MCD9015467.1 hypothetical protein [Parachryseolinea silvisoli]